MTRDVIVIGGGVVGLAVAWKAAAAGLATTLITDPARPAASGAAVGGLSFCPADSVLAGDRAVVELSQAAKRDYPEFISSLEDFTRITTQFRRRPTLVTEQAGADTELMGRIEAARAMVGLVSTRLSPAECREVEPTLAATVGSGLLLEDHHQIDSRALSAGLLAACEKSGVQLRHDPAVRILAESGRATGVELRSGVRIASGKVVVAAGAWSGSLDGLPAELRDSVRPIAGQIVIARAAQGTELPQHDLRNSRIYIVTRSDRTIVVGATKEEKGFDHEPTVGSVHSLVREAERLWPGMAGCTWLETVVGMRPASIDKLPVLGHTSIPGILAATGHYRNGIMFAAASADAVVAMMTGRHVSPLFSAFSPSRLTAA